MHNDTIKVANKIITDNDLENIFIKMNEVINEMNKICKNEDFQNERYEREYQTWTAKNFEGKIKTFIDLYDDTQISTESYGEFMTLFNTRIREIKYMTIYYSLSYYTQKPGENDIYNSSSIKMEISETKMNISVKLDGNKMDEVYQLIKNIILNAPERYDRIIKKKSSITTKITFALGIIPSMALLFLLIFVPTIRELYATSFVMYPIGSLLLGFFLGSIFNGQLDKLYENIVPKKKYKGYDRDSGKSIYVDDVDSYTENSEIIIGKNIDNIRNREEIKRLETKYSKYIPYELLALLITSIIVVIVGILM